MHILRHILIEPRDTLYSLRQALLCRVFRSHGPACIGRMDHWPTASVRGRWRKSGHWWDGIWLKPPRDH